MTKRRISFVRFIQSVNYLNILIPIIAVAFSLLVSSLPILYDGKNPFEAYRELFFGAVGNPIRLGDTLSRATPILFTGLASALSFRAGIFNMGGEGQLYIGALGGTLVALFFPGLPRFLLIPFSFITAFIFGGVWSLIPGILKAYRDVNEVIVTIMMNFVGFWIISYLVHGPLAEQGAWFYYTPEVVDAAKLPILIHGTQFNLGYIIALVGALLIYILINRTSFGFKLRAVGGNIEAAHYAGINTKKILLSAFFINGGIVGLAGAIEILGVQYRLSDFFSPGYGWDGIGVALIGNTSVVGVILASHFFGLLRAGSGVMARRLGVPSAITGMIQGLSIFFTVLGLAIQMTKPKKKSSRSKTEALKNKEHS